MQGAGKGSGSKGKASEWLALYRAFVTFNFFLVYWMCVCVCVCASYMYYSVVFFF